MDTIQLLGSAMGLGFVAGLRLYSTVLVLGLGLRYGFLHPPAGFEQHIRVLTNPWVLTAAGVAYLAEFFADKIPWVDSLWDAVHTFVRPIGAALLGLTVSGATDPALKAAVVIICGGVAFTSHSSKAATRLAINHSPEPVSNIATSLAEDLFAPFGVWLSLKHPTLVLVLVLLSLLVFGWLSPRVFRLVSLQLIALRSWIAGPSRVPSGVAFDCESLNPAAVGAISVLARSAVPLPADHANAVRKATSRDHGATGIHCAATRQIKGLRNSAGYLALSQDGLVFVTRRLFRYRVHRTSAKDVLSAELKRGILLNRLILHTTAGELSFYLFKDITIRDQATVDHRRTATA